VKLPKEIDDVTAAALPNAVIGSAMALLFKAKMKRGETVLINGATGFTGRIAVQIAKHYGAKKIFITGRNEQSLKSLLTLGANEIIFVQQNDEAFIKQIKNLHNITPIDIVIDYLWGHTAELILEALKGEGLFTHQTRFVSIGTVTGDKIQLSGEILRSVDLQLSGSGIGSWKRNEVQILFRKILPEMFRLAAKKKLKVDTVTIDLKEIEKSYDMNIPDGNRLVVTI
jgi:NADPH:quinone reductase-like Zn-dependent oxidoreductase